MQVLPSIIDSARSIGSFEALVADLGAALDPSRVRTGSVEVGLYKRDASTIEGVATVVSSGLGPSWSL